MKQTRAMEIAVGLFMAAGLAAIFVLAMKVSNIASLGGDEGYVVSASFDNVGGLKVRAPVTMGGVRIGRVENISFNDRSYEAVVTLRIEQRYQHIPVDTTANIYTAGLLGEQYVALEPGGADQYLRQGGHIKLTQSALVLEQMIGRFLFDKAAGGNGDKSATGNNQ